MNLTIPKQIAAISTSAILTILMLPFVVVGFATRCVQIAWIAGWNGANSFWDKR